jgi:hypothetical protein
MLNSLRHITERSTQKVCHWNNGAPSDIGRFDVSRNQGHRKATTSYLLDV